MARLTGVPVARSVPRHQRYCRGSLGVLAVAVEPVSRPVLLQAIGTAVAPAQRSVRSTTALDECLSRRVRLGP